jgi:Methyltransferase FkbM domain
MASLISLVKTLLPRRPVSLPIVRGPFRGGRFYSNPRVSLRKVFGLYEAELNPWVAEALKRTDLVLDVGANDGYFTFGCAAAMKRHGKAVRIISFEPLSNYVRQLEIARSQGGFTPAEIKVVPKLVGRAAGPDMVTLDMFTDQYAGAHAPLIKIDVEGAETDVLEGASRWFSPHTMLLIEVHKAEYLEEIPRRLAGSGGALDRVDQKALPVLGREQRDEANWWLLSRLR